jgi:hypothetical protein
MVATPPPSSGDAALRFWPLLSTVDAGDADHFYALVTRRRGGATEFHASDDGGASWQPRTEPPLPAHARRAALASLVTVLGAQILAWVRLGFMRHVPSSPTPIDPSKFLDIEPPVTWISVDGGRTWNEPDMATEPVEAVPAGTRLVNGGLASQIAPRELHAIDPATGRIAPLAHQPTGIEVPRGWVPIADTPPSAGMWVQGRDPATRKPALAVSHDQGRTWTTHVFTEGLPAEERDGLTPTMYQPTVVSTDGQTAYVLIYGDKRDRGYRTTDGGAVWQRVPGDYALGRPYSSFVAGDGSHVVLLTRRPGPEFWASRDGHPYAPVTLTGFPMSAESPVVPRTGDRGRYLAWTSGPTAAIYISDDGWTWRPTPIP